jgi:hypothetical protein
VQRQRAYVGGGLQPGAASSNAQSLVSFFASQTIHNRKILKKKSGHVNDEANFSFLGQMSRSG